MVLFGRLVVLGPHLILMKKEDMQSEISFLIGAYDAAILSGC